MSNLFKNNTKSLENRIEILEKTNQDLLKGIENITKGFDSIIGLIDYYNFIEKYANNLYLYNNELKSMENNIRKNFNPLVSIIIPVYNGENYVEKAIDSALEQTYKNVEIIVVDDGSTDNTEKVVKKYKKQVKYYKKENGGVSSALNFGIKKMSGEYFAWLSHDDLFYPNYISEHIKYLERCDNDIITYTNYDIIDENGKLRMDLTISGYLYSSDYKLSKITKYSEVLIGEINGGSILIPKKAFDEVGNFNEKERISQEKDMWIRILEKYKLVNIPMILTSIRQHSGQVTNKKKDIIEENINNKVCEMINRIDKIEKTNEYWCHDAFYEILLKNYKVNNKMKLYDEIEEMYKKDLK